MARAATAVLLAVLSAVAVHAQASTNNGPSLPSLPASAIDPLPFAMFSCESRLGGGGRSSLTSRPCARLGSSETAPNLKRLDLGPADAPSPLPLVPSHARRADLANALAYVSGRVARRVRLMP